MPKSLIPTTPKNADPSSAPDPYVAPSDPSDPAVPTLAVATLDTAQPLVEVFQPFQVTLDTWKAKAASLTVTNLSQKAEMQQARLARLELKESRVNLEKKRKSLVEHLKARTSKIDATAKVIRDEMETLETKLLASEQFADRHAAQLKAETKLLREKELAPFIDTPILGDLSDLTQAQWASVLSSAALAHQAKIDLARKAEQEAAAKAKAEQEERERIAVENARLKAEAEQARQAQVEAEAKTKAEREAAEAERTAQAQAAAAEMKRIADIAEAERQRVEAATRAERQRLQREHEAQQAEARQQAAAAQAEAQKAREELRKKQEAEAAEKRKLEAERKASEKAAKAAAAAPDKSKLKVFAHLLLNLPHPPLNDQSIQKQLSDRVAQLADWAVNVIDDQPTTLL